MCSLCRAHSLHPSLSLSLTFNRCSVWLELAQLLCHANTHDNWVELLYFCPLNIWFAFSFRCYTMCISRVRVCSIVLAVVSASKVIVIIEFKWVFRIQRVHFSVPLKMRIRNGGGRRESDREGTKLCIRSAREHNMTEPIWRIGNRQNALKINHHLFIWRATEKSLRLLNLNFELNKNDKLLWLVQLRFNWIGESVTNSFG